MISDRPFVIARRTVVFLLSAWWTDIQSDTRHIHSDGISVAKSGAKGFIQHCRLLHFHRTGRKFFLQIKEKCDKINNSSWTCIALTSDKTCRLSLRRAYVKRDLDCRMANPTAYYEHSQAGDFWTMGRWQTSEKLPVLLFSTPVSKFLSAHSLFKKRMVLAKMNRVRIFWRFGRHPPKPSKIQPQF